jgi:HAD superfamily hydrolase (TIGR01549 family)
MSQRIPICDLDGTLVDSDAALAAAFRKLGIADHDITYGHVLAEECQRLGIHVDDYLAAYDPLAAHPFPGVDELLSNLSRWAVCSNKHPLSGWAELDRLDWCPDVVHFADSFNGPKQLEPSLQALGVSPDQVVFVGDTDHDRKCAADAGVTFVLAGWNRRAKAHHTDVVLSHPHQLLELLG